MTFNETDLIRVLTGADLRDELKENTVSLRWATVTQLDPLMVRRDGEFEDFEVTGTAVPVELLSVSDVVRVSNFGSKAFIESSEYTLQRFNTNLTGLANDVGNLTSGLAASNLRWGTYMDRDTDFNDYTTPGIYYNNSSANVATIANCPTPVAGSLHVVNAANIIQTYHEYSADSVYANSWRRVYVGGTWSPWLPEGLVLKRYALSLESSWENYGSAFMTASVSVTRDGYVHLEGVVRNGTVTGVITTLPTWARPARTQIVTAMTGGGAARLDIYANGQVKQTGSNNSFVSLTGISFFPGW